VTILDALADENLFGAAFPDRDGWSTWLAFLAAVFDLDMTDHQAALYRRHTGRQSLPTARAREVWCIAGRRAGKSRIAALLAVFIAAFHNYTGRLAPGEKATVAVIAADRQQARVCFRYIVGLLDACPMLQALVERQTQSSVELRGNVVIEVHTCSFKSTRGYSFAAVIADEVAFWRSENSASPDVEVLTAVRPGLATIPGSMLIAISSPYARRGALWQAFKVHYGKDGDPVLVWKAASSDMNPTIPAHVIADGLAADEAAARAEWLAEFRSDLEAFVSREVIEAATVPGRVRLPPGAKVQHVGFADPSAGSSDAFALAIAHGEDRDGTRVTVLDYVSERRSPFSPDAVVAEFAAALKSYGVTKVQADHYAGQWVVEAFAKHGITCEQTAQPKSEIYLNVLPLLNSGRVELLDHARLHAQFLGLERRTSRVGKDVVDHPPGAHDDLANAVAGALVAAQGPSEPAMLRWTRLYPREARGELVSDLPTARSGTAVHIRHLCGACLREWSEPDGPGVNQVFHTATCPACTNPDPAAA
jgi:hypothetical protein